VALNNVNPKKLLNSKWTAVEPTGKEKHFMVTDVEFDEEGVVTSCLLEAILSKHATPIQWRDLQDASRWIHGWK